MGQHDLGLGFSEPQFPLFRWEGGCFGTGSEEDAAASWVDRSKHSLAARVLGAPQGACDPHCPLGARWSFGEAHRGEGEGGEVSMPGPSPSTGWLGPEITGASRKIISICLGHGKAGPQAPPPAGNGPPRPHPSALAHRLCPHPPRGQLKLVEQQHPPTQGGRSGCRAAGRAGGGLASPSGVLARRGRSGPRSGRSRPALSGARAGGSPGSVWK